MSASFGKGALRVGMTLPSGEIDVAYATKPSDHPLPLGEGWLTPSTDGYVLTCSAAATDGTGLAWVSPSSASLPSGTQNQILATPNGSSGATSLRAMVAADLPTVTVAKGGTGLTSLGTANQVLAVNSGGTALTYATPSAGLSAIANLEILANISGSSAAPTANTVSDVLDAAFTASARGTFLHRGASGWAALAPGPNTYVLASQGASADLHWVAPATGGSGASTANAYIVQTTASDCANAQVLASLSTGLLKVTTTTGVLSTAAAGTDYISPSGTWAGNSSITTLGTIGTGVWQGTAIGAGYLPSTGLTITQWGGALGTGSISGGTATFNLGTYNRWTLTLDHTQTVTLALSNVSVGQQFTIALSQDSTGSCLVTWFSGIKWAGGSAPTLTTAASKGDLFTFLCVGAGSYWGMIAGQNF